MCALVLSGRKDQLVPKEEQQPLQHSDTPLLFWGLSGQSWAGPAGNCPQFLLHSQWSYHQVTESHAVTAKLCCDTGKDLPALGSPALPWAKLCGMSLKFSHLWNGCNKAPLACLLQKWNKLCTRNVINYYLFTSIDCFQQDGPGQGLHAVNNPRMYRFMSMVSCKRWRKQKDRVASWLSIPSSVR